MEELQGITFGANKSAKESEICRRLQAMNSFRQQGALCDVIILANGKEYPAHRTVLAAGSEYFYNLFTTNMKEKKEGVVKLEGLSCPVLDHVLTYLYTCEVDIRETSTAQEIMAAADYLLIHKLKEIACEFLQSKLCSGNCFEMFHLAHNDNCLSLKNDCCVFIDKNFTELVKCEGFLGLNVDELLELISRDEIVVKKEEEVYEAILSWIKREESTRASHFSKLFSQVRLISVAEHYLHRHIAQEKLVRADQTCMDQVLNAMRWHSLQDQGEAQVVKPRNCLQAHTEVVFILGMFAALRKPIPALVNLNPRCKLMCYCPNEGSWYLTEKMASNLNMQSIVGCQGFLYTLGGAPLERVTNRVERYDPKTNSWTFVSNMPQTQKLIHAGVAILNGCIYTVGGKTPDGPCTLVQRFDPSSNSWDIVAPLVEAKWGICAVSDGEFLYSAGGSDGKTPIDTMEKYNPTLDTWTLVSPMTERRATCSGCFLPTQREICIVGGFGAIKTTNHALNSCEVYNIQTDQWHHIASMLYPRIFPAVVFINDKVSVFGGYTSAVDTVSDEAETYDPGTQTWKKDTSPPFVGGIFHCCSYKIHKDLLHSLERIS